ncbi:MAG: AMP-binding protein [Candidatus Latescibacterota bacterium]|nr:MAG: AMP-binding protein [Candidatus Latescibacterota bacterium]
MNFLERILDGLRQEPETIVLQEAWEGHTTRASARELLQWTAHARAFLRSAGLERGERCVLLAPNGIQWAAVDLAIMAEGILKVPMYTRQAPEERVKMMQDCGATLIVCGSPELRDDIQRLWPEAPLIHTLEEVFAAPAAEPKAVADAPVALRDEDPVTVIYTSGTSGDSKGVVLTVGNLNHMLSCTMQRMDELMHGLSAQERVFHYLPFCFAGSWILLLSSLTRRSLLTLATDLDKLAEQLRVGAPHYFLNVPILLERIREGIDRKLSSAFAPIRALYVKACAAWSRQQAGQTTPLDSMWLALARVILFRSIKRRISPNLVALICGSAPLSSQTQLFFEMLGITVLQVYGLTETTAICTMDRPRGKRRAGYVGHAIAGTEMKLGENSEILVRGPHIFPGYWQRPEATAECIRDGWLHTGDQGEVDADGNWRIIGRVKNVIVLSSGHNVAPDPIEESLQRAVPGAEQVVVVGHERKHLSAIFTGNPLCERIDAVLEELNAALPHYKKVRAYHVHPEPFSIENGFLTANGKLKRQRVLEQLEPEIERMYNGAGG